MLSPIYGDGLQQRDWLHVSDHCRAIESVRTKGRIGEVYHIGAEETTRSNLEIAQMIADILGKPHTLLEHVTDRLGHDWRYSLDTTKIKTELGWVPQIDFRIGLEETISWFEGKGY